MSTSLRIDLPKSKARSRLPRTAANACLRHLSSDRAIWWNCQKSAQTLDLAVDQRQLVKDGLHPWFSQCCIDQALQAVPFFLEESEPYTICNSSKSEQP